MEKEYRYKSYVFRRKYIFEGEVEKKRWEILSEMRRRGKCFYDSEFIQLTTTGEYKGTLKECKEWVDKRLELFGVNHKKKAARRKSKPGAGSCMPGRYCYFCGYGQLFHSNKIKLEG